jgi:site-specific recombinase XerD
MGTVRKTGEEYYIEFYARGLLYQQKAGKDRGAAERMLEDVEGKIQRGEMGIIVRDVDIDIFFKTYLEYCRQESEPRSCQRYASVIVHFQEFCTSKLPERMKLSEVTPSVIENYRVLLTQKHSEGGPPVRPIIVNLTLFLLKCIFDYAIKLGYLNDNPVLHTRWMEVKDHRIPRTLTDSDVAKLLPHCEGDLRDIVIMILKTGIRVRELVRLTWTMVDFKKKMIKIEAIHNDGSKPLKARGLPFDQDMEAIFHRFRMKKATVPGFVFVADDGKPFEEKYLREELRQAAAMSAIEGPVNFEVLRNMFVRKVLGRGVSLVDVHRLLGLNDIAKVMRYAAFAPREAAG